MARCHLESCFLTYNHHGFNDNLLISTKNTRTKQHARKDTKPCVLSKAADVLLSLEPVVATEDNMIDKTCNESNVHTEESVFKRLRMSGIVLHY